MNDPIIQLPVWEPASVGAVRLSEEILCQHLLVIGATGSGKSCLLHRLLEQLIHHPDRPGLLICDAKADDTIARVRAMTHVAGREDIVVLGPNGTHYLDLFAPLKSFADVDLMTRRLLIGTASMGGDNAFWDEARYALIDAALTLLLAMGKRLTFDLAIRSMREWFFTTPGLTPQLRELLNQLAVAGPKAGRVQARKMALARDTFVMWHGFDPKTRSNVQGCLMNAFRPLLSVPAAQCFEPAGRPVFNVADVATRNRVCAVSVNALVEPGLAALLLKLIKGDFLRAVQGRQDSRQPLCGLIADEFPLLATADDVETLATVRSRRCFVVAASQGISAITEKLGPRLCQSLLTNFGTTIFLRTREKETGEFAALHLGTREEKINLPTRPGVIVESWQPTPKRIVRRQIPICPPGTLGRLAPHQGFIVLPHADSPKAQLWFVPWFEDAPNNVQPAKFNPGSVEHTRTLMARDGHHECTSASAVTKLLSANVTENIWERKQLLAATKTFFRSKCAMIPEGLGALPAPWLRALPGILWSTRKPHWTLLPYMIKEVTYEQGMLLVQFAQELPPESSRLSSWDRLRITLNKSLHPNVWRPLNRRHALKLPRLQPDLPDVG
jgi:hypothetical protein